MEDRQDRPVADRVQELVAVPARGERTRLRLTVAHDAAGDQVGVVEHGSVGVGEGIAELAPLVDGPRRLRRDVARDPAREGELPEEPAHAGLVPADRWVHLRVGPLEVDVGDHARPSVARAGDVQSVQVPGADHPVHVDVDEIEAGGRAPVTEQARLDVLGAEGLAD